jgi:hypothetical protein
MYWPDVVHATGDADAGLAGEASNSGRWRAADDRQRDAGLRGGV